jgi:small-conductance mechanosensitive channel
LSFGEIVYLLVVASIGGAAVVRASSWLGRVRRMRMRLLQGRRVVGTLEGQGPVDDADERHRARSEAAIEQQFTVSQRLVIPGIVALTALGMALPFLSQVPAAALSALLAVLTVVAGITLRPVVENAIAGLVISSSRLISLGDTVMLDDIYGTVEDISPTHTTIKVWDWRRLVIPNSAMLSKELVNYSLFDRFCWAWVDFWVEPRADLAELEDALLSLPKSSDRWLDDSDVEMWVMELSPAGVRCRLAAWAANPSDAWYLKDHLRRGVHRHLIQEGVLPARQHVELHGDAASRTPL